MTVNTVFVALGVCLTVAVALASSPPSPPPQQQPTSTPTASYNICVYASTPAGVGAAVAAATYDQDLTILLLEPTGYVGGMAGPGGIGFRDWSDPRLINSTARRFAMLNAERYSVDYPVWDPSATIGNASFYHLLGQHPSIDLVLNERLVEGRAGVTVSNKRVTHLTTAGPNGTGARPSTWECQFVVDASYEGDVMTFANVSNTWGRESRQQYNESLAGVTATSKNQFDLPVSATWDNGTLLNWIQDRPDPRTVVGQADDAVMAYSYRLCLSSDPDNRVPIAKPDGYQTSDFELSARYLRALSEKGLSTPGPWSLLTFRGLPTADRRDACCGMAQVGIDAVGLALGYSNGTYADRNRIAKAHFDYVLGLAYFWQTDPDAPIPPAMRSEYAAYGLCKDSWPENNHIPPQLYVREARRLVGDFVFTQNDRIASSDPGGCHDDSIGISSWGIDIHGMERVAVSSFDSTSGGPFAFNEGLTDPGLGGAVTAEMPYSLLLPKRSEMVNLLVPNCPSITHVAFAGVREEPTLVQLGEAAGNAAAIAVKTNTPELHDVDPAVLQAAQRGMGVLVHFPDRPNCSVPAPPPTPPPTCSCSAYNVTGAGSSSVDGVYKRSDVLSADGYPTWKKGHDVLSVSRFQWRIGSTYQNFALPTPACPPNKDWVPSSSGVSPVPSFVCLQ